jgi:hypothetical protein
MEDARAAAKNDGRWLFQRAAEGKRGEEALLAIGDAYIDEMFDRPRSASRDTWTYTSQNSDPEIREVVRIGYGDLVAYAEQVSGLSPERISSFLATGMLLSVLALMQLQDGAEHWAETLLEGCRKTCRASAPDPLLMGAICGKSLPEDGATLAVRRWRVSEPV